MDNTPPVKKSSRVLERIRKEKAANASKQDIGSTNTKYLFPYYCPICLYIRYNI